MYHHCERTGPFWWAICQSISIPPLTFESLAVQHINLLVSSTHENIISGVKLGDASKKLGKKFATGASVVKVHISYIYLDQMTFSLFTLILYDSWMISLSGPNRQRANWCSRGHILRYCRIYNRYLAWCNSLHLPSLFIPCYWWFHLEGSKIRMISIDH